MKSRTQLGMASPVEEALGAAAADHNIEVRPPGGLSAVGSVGVGTVELSRGRSVGRYRLARPRAMTLAEVSQLPAGDEPLLVVGERISERSAEAFRAMGVEYIDAAGNVYLRFGDVYIDIRGRKSAAPARRKRDVPNLFSARRMQVLFAVLVWPEIASLTVREVSHVSRTSVGLTQETLRGLEEAGYFAHGTLARRGDLLDLWTAAYRGTLLPKLRLGSYHGVIGAAVKVVEGAAPILTSGERAVAERIRPETLTLYTDEFDPRMPLVNRWRTDGEPNIEVRQKFWCEPDGVPPHRPGLAGSVPSLLVYADLMATGEARQREVAAGMRDRDEL